MQSDEFIKISKRKIIEDFYKKDQRFVDEDKVLLVWFCKTVQNWKGIFTTTFPDGKIFEVTYNGDVNELYIDEYIKNKKNTYHIKERDFEEYKPVYNIKENNSEEKENTY